MTSLSVASSSPRTVTTTTVTPSTVTLIPALTSTSSISKSPNPTTNLNPPADTAPPANTSLPPSPAPNATKQMNPQANTTQPKPPIITPAASGPQPQQCSYIVTHILSGFMVNVSMDPTTTNYTINLKETGQTIKTINPTFNQSFHEIKHLKPCTEYVLNLTFTDSTGQEKPCGAESTNTTLGMSEYDVQNGTCMSGYVCYRSEWDSSSLSTSYNIPAEQCKSDNKTFCIKPRYNDICTDLTTTFPSENCLTSFNLTRSITVDFLNSFEINQTASTKLPAQIEPKLPPSCIDLTVGYTCHEVGESNTKNLSDLKPFTDYSCTGQVQNGNVTLKNTAAVSFRVDCDFTLNAKVISSTNTSIKLSWNTSSENCGDVLKNLSYVCSCSHKERTPKGKHTADLKGSVGTCDVRGLEPFTQYHCEVQTKYDGTLRPTTGNTITPKTDFGRPEEVTSLHVKRTDNNRISVTCNSEKHSNGLLKKYTATLSNDGAKPKTLNSNECKFEFKDLSYSTEYTVEVIFCNEKFCSKPKKDSAQTSYNIGRPIIFVVTILIFSVALAVALYKIIQSRTSRSEDGTLELNAIYENVPRSDDIRPTEPPTESSV
uniref:receptor-type tyrosine-protein phosphatase C-like isoform X2 n=1 Tax=Gasterosteus aculeatus aculeatus TaxID=481459 RepID=UPI001A98FB07|nr:receptor-type tyrosine-protein phosphatase C-like isoform X2 [Gasterosteus aculeatus aculeatus]